MVYYELGIKGVSNKQVRLKQWRELSVGRLFGVSGGGCSRDKAGEEESDFIV